MTDNDEIGRLRAEIEERRARLLELQPPLSREDLTGMTAREIADLPPGVLRRALDAMTLPARVF